MRSTEVVNWNFLGKNRSAVPNKLYIEKKYYNLVNIFQK